MVQRTPNTRPLLRPSPITPQPRQLTPDQQPVQLRAAMGSPGLSRAVTTNVGAGQNAPPSPTISHSCGVSASRSTLDLAVAQHGKLPTQQ